MPEITITPSDYISRIGRQAREASRSMARASTAAKNAVLERIAELLLEQEADIRAEYPADDLLADTYEDSCLEFFLSPVAGDTRYLNFEFNPNCAVGAQIGTEKANRTRLVRTDDVYAASSARTEDGWEITYKLPFDFIRQFYPDFTAESGDVLRGNFYKCGNLTASKHYLSWNPIDSDTPNFHVPECFGELVLE